MHNITSVIWKRHSALTNPTDPEVKAEEGGERQGFSQNPAFHEKKKEKGKRGRQSSGISTGMAAKKR